jgi:hypothetical protein
MKLVFFGALAIVLCGCASHPDYRDLPTDSHCTQTANHRAEGAGYSGEDTDTQRIVFDKVYAECIFWRNKQKLARPSGSTGMERDASWRMGYATKAS